MGHEQPKKVALDRVRSNPNTGNQMPEPPLRPWQGTKNAERDLVSP